ncbi:MAG: FHA domain-containing protein [Lachnospiraceae bacterium]|nr:FHA domain-containing protein [Lachnospiraceae bacterium]
MAVGYKNLILIDNSKSVGAPNFQLCKETAKYICSNIAAGDSCRIADFGEDVSYLTDYSEDTDVLLQSIDGIEMRDRDTYITDNLVDILTEWKEQDVACRNIIIFTDGEENDPVLHANEELYYILSESGYPVYVVQSVESNSVPASKNLSAISTISGGKLLLTEFEGSEGGSEKIMGDAILEAIASRKETIDRSVLESGDDDVNKEQAPMQENSDAGSVKADESIGTDADLFIDTDLKMQEGYSTSEQTLEPEKIYSVSENTPIIRNADLSEGRIGFSVIFPALGLLFAMIFAIVIYVITRRNSRYNMRDRRMLAAIDEELDRESLIAEAAEDYDCRTYKLDEDCTVTRLLEQTDCGHDITLEDCSDPTRLFRACCDDSLIIGRLVGLCDIVLDHDDSVSGRHCELSVRNGCWYVRDLQSSNGTKVNNQKVFQELMLKCGDILQLGQSALQVRI